MSQLNIRGFITNKENIVTDKTIKETWVMCFTETFLDESTIVNPDDIERPDMKIF